MDNIDSMSIKKIDNINASFNCQLQKICGQLVEINDFVFRILCNLSGRIYRPSI